MKGFSNTLHFNRNWFDIWVENKCEKLFDQKMNSRVWLLWRSLSVFIHIIAVCVYGFGLVFQFIYYKGYNWRQSDEQLAVSNSTVVPPEYTFGWKYKYLSFWNMVCVCLKSILFGINYHLLLLFSPFDKTFRLLWTLI